jgi:Ala-tRNA(Pro) deacylase
MLMLAKVVEYLRSNGVPFRLLSFPSPEPAPRVAHRSPESVVVETHVLLIDGRPTLACIPRGERVNVAGLLATLNASLIEEEGARETLPWPFGGETVPIPPLGRLFGTPLLIDEALLRVPVLSFETFSSTDFLELTFDDFARLERPRIEAVAMAGELPQATQH